VALQRAQVGARTKWVPQWRNLGSRMAMAIANPTDRHDALICGRSKMGEKWVSTWGHLGFHMGNIGFTRGLHGFTGLGRFTAGHTGLTGVASGIAASTRGFYRRKVGVHMGKSGFSNGDGGGESDRQARRYKLLCWFQHGELWVSKWGNLRPQPNRQARDVL
jgi:hypothetical protein